MFSVVPSVAGEPGGADGSQLHRGLPAPGQGGRGAPQQEGGQGAGEYYRSYVTGGRGQVQTTSVKAVSHTTLDTSASLPLVRKAEDVLDLKDVNTKLLMNQTRSIIWA